MALVAYDNSDSSDYDEDTKEVTPVAFLNQKTEKKSSLKLPEPIQIQETTKLDEDTQSNKEPNLFNLLPQPLSKNSTVIEEDDEFLHKREVTNGVKPKAKITVPSLNDFKDVETSNSIPKPRVSNGKKSGLLSMLPQPKNGVTTTTRSLIPNVLTKKPSTSSVAKNNPTPVKKPHINPTSTLINDYSDDSDNEEVQNDFFSINKPVELSADVDVPIDIEQNTSIEVINASKPERRGIESFFKKEESSHVEVEPDYDNYSIDQSEPGSSIDGYGSENPSSNEVTLDEEAIMKLCGSRGKRKREDIQIVDINQQDVLADAREMLLKGLMDDTTKRVSASKRKGNEPTSQQRRKHQITYLAYQAKANEAELQNQWSNNKMSKRQTQAKYGF